MIILKVLCPYDITVLLYHGHASLFVNFSHLGLISVSPKCQKSFCAFPESYGVCAFCLEQYGRSKLIKDQLCVYNLLFYDLFTKNYFIFFMAEDFVLCSWH